MFCTWGVLLSTWCAIGAVTGKQLDEHIGYFWQITDIHYDPNYSTHQMAPFRCHPGGDRVLHHRPGKFGDFLCDSPWTLAVSAVHAMGTIAPEPDFIVWTGDNIPHVEDSDLSPDKVYHELSRLTKVLEETFPGTPVLPTLGNHDGWQANLLPPGDSSYYRDLLEHSGWDSLMNQETQEQFVIGGFYSSELSERLVHIGLNTLLWYRFNSLAANHSDPASQLYWLRQELTAAQHRRQKVLITGHVPPGVPGRKPLMFGWLWDSFTEEFLSLMEEYSDIVMATIFAHEHTDGYRIMYDQEGNPAVPMYLGPAVTPMLGKAEGITTNNPSVRLYKYDRTTGQILDIFQYYLDLLSANAMGVATWQEEYTFTSAYNLPDAGANSLQILTNSFKIPSNKNFRKYFLYNSVMYDQTSNCTGACVWLHICAAEHVSFPTYKKCMIEHGNDIFNDTNTLESEMFYSVDVDKNHSNPLPPHPYPPHPPHHHPKHQNVPGYMYILIIVLVVIVIMLFIIITILCMQQRRHLVVYHSKTRAGYMAIDT